MLGIFSGAPVALGPGGRGLMLSRRVVWDLFAARGGSRLQGVQGRVLLWPTRSAPASAILRQLQTQTASAARRVPLRPCQPHNCTATAARRLIHASRVRRSKPGHSNGGNNKVEPPVSFSQRLKKLSREYGWTVLAVYLGLTLLDFPLCYLLVRWVGVEKIAEVEHWIVSNVESLVPEPVKALWSDACQTIKGWMPERAGSKHKAGVEEEEEEEMAGWGVKEAQEKHQQGASFWTQMALAYAIHKSFIVFRVPLTAAVLPSVVRALRRWGWKLPGRRVPK